MNPIVQATRFTGKFEPSPCPLPPSWERESAHTSSIMSRGLSSLSHELWERAGVRALLLPQCEGLSLTLRVLVQKGLEALVADLDFDVASALDLGLATEA